MADKTMGKELFNYLCEKVGNEKVVKARKVFFKVFDVCYNLDKSVTESISSGSKPEGLDIPGSDLDLMVMDTTNVVYTEHSRGKHCLTKFELVMDTNNTPSGFAHLKVILPANEINNKFIHIHNVHLELIQNESDLLLPNTNLKEYHMRALNNIAQVFVTHGPCTSTKNGTLDFMFCFRTDEWPREALNWLYRPRFHDWPSEDLIADIIQEKKSVLLVPIGSKFGATEDNPLEWRISFSVAEKMLVQSFNHTQILCYAMLKILLKEVLNTKKETEQLLCSYFMKTLLFWLLEETPASVWTPDNLFKCFKACITKLSYHIKHGYFPNYFVLQNNMFEGKIMGCSQKNLIRVISNIYSEGIHFTLRTRILHDFTKAKTNSHIHTASHDVDKAIYPLLKYVLLLHYFNPSDKLIPTLHHCITVCKSNLVKSLFSLVLATQCILRAADTNYDFNKTNDHLYSKYTSLLPYFVLGTNFNLNGWLPLAMFFYQHKQFLNCLKIIDFVCSGSTYKKNDILTCHEYVMPTNRQSYKHEYYTDCKISFLKRYKSLCNVFIPFGVKADTVFDKADFHWDAGPFEILSNGKYKNVVLFDEPQLKFGRYIRFLCYHHLHYLDRKLTALHDFQHIFANTDFTQHKLLNMVYQFDYLCDAYQKSNIEIPHNVVVKALDQIMILMDNVPEFHDFVFNLSSWFT